MARHPFTRGLHDLGRGCFTFLQPNGGWGWSNAGLIVSGKESLLVDTLIDLRQTGEMLDEMKRKVPAARTIDTVVITHANADHFLGNQLVSDSRILASKKTKAAIEKFDIAPSLAMTRNWEAFGDVGWFFHHATAGAFDYEGVIVTPPSDGFEGQTTLRVGEKTVIVTDLGPAHTESDAIIHVPEDRIVYTGDLQFTEGHPVIWAGPYANWIAACAHILSLDVETVVPGHGPISDKSDVRALKHYFEYVLAESRKRFDAGLNFYDAAKDIEMDAFRDWIDGERLVANVLSAYREFDPHHLDGVDTALRAAAANPFNVIARWVRECGWGHGHPGGGDHAH